MPDIALDLRYLRYAMLVAEQGSFRRVAALLDVSQSTIGRRVRLLERRLGAPLFERDRSGALVNRLVEAGAGATAPQVGEPMPAFLLPDEQGRLVRLNDLLGEGPVAIAFNRGQWCPAISVGVHDRSVR